MSLRVWGRTWQTIVNTGGHGIYSSSGTSILPSGQPPGQQASVGTPVARWVAVTTNANGNNDLVNLTWLCQILKLSPQESPFYSSSGVPAQQSVQTGVPPDFYLAVIQQQFAPLFASLSIARVPQGPGSNPYYQINVTTRQGVRLNPQVPIPT